MLATLSGAVAAPTGPFVPLGVVLQGAAPPELPMAVVVRRAVVVATVSVAVGFGVGAYRGGSGTDEAAASPDRTPTGERDARSDDRGAADGAPGRETPPAADASPTAAGGLDRSGDAGDGRTGSTTTAASRMTVKPRHEPDRIPRAPDVDVDHDALTDEEPIGGGGNADVVRATLPTPDGDVTLAVKRPRLSRTMHADAVERMLSEAEAWDRLDDHDHVVGVVDYGAEPLPWIAMEYMDAGHLGERAGNLGMAQALWTALSVTRGVRHAHRRGVAHLDLKPANVLFREVDGAWDVPKVADWGLSKHLLDHSGSVEGLSPQYAAPEQFDADRGPADDITDVYQLGALFYELFTGRPPFEGSATAVMRAVLEEEPVPPSEVADVPPALDDVLLGMLATDRGDRYDSVVYVRDALAELYDDR